MEYPVNPGIRCHIDRPPQNPLQSDIFIIYQDKIKGFSADNRRDV
ncbi:Uncharacterized protein dnm_032990 [Desulfonema magnum]|uniref:Uncharacterized protein n=1 Tax=Desulfonema magnum TaxID=45655 RepID=A0A975GN12_9BACT|nr:Uncharacterized protein dnm_032990 [Desulfonema magnum]